MLSSRRRSINCTTSQVAHNRITEVRANFPSSLTSLYVRRELCGFTHRDYNRCLAGNNITAFYANRSQFELLARLRNPNKSSLTYDRHRGASGKWNFQGPCDIVLSTTATNTTCVDHTHTRLLFDVFPICMLPDDEASTGSSSAPSEGYLHVVGVAAGGMLLLLTLLMTTTFYRHRATKWQSSTSHETHLPLETPLAIRNDVRFDPALRSRRVPASDVERHAVLARGGCGIVYRASIHGSRMVAMKRILPTRADDINVVEDFMAEIRLSASLEHPNIVAFVGMTWTSVYNLSAIYELMSHGDLWQFLRRSHGLTWHGPGVSKASILRDVVAALVYLHALSPMVVHRDLKAKNVLLNDAYVAKLGDFGTSRECADHTMTAEIGTVPWIAPEVLKGTRYSEKADIYSFGVLVSEVDTVKVPYSNVHDCCPSADGTSVALASANIAMRVVKGTLQPSFSPSCPSVVLDIARQCLSYDPDDRPSAAQLAAWLQRLSL
ncbi:TKL protein kinase [Saprolegnia parasitica CBS 223.65]|uniref:TKL protein kinase n=1 Tax=Saprolegnia parasitica (strain CBS 223.65) TaxID=695850 RepID=A0A067CS90_SAPPC|nr:TKL protein kinase [Saprolegnia parasitica CBS 223.65]KDO33373.1 TKL protein kinase [Saprolegnia parasitica CBS 223.65]|eukprot:XP_012196121.1 TKL protein kinase [Saprolegnia parasitica CBS 223.65]